MSRVQMVLLPSIVLCVLLTFAAGVAVQAQNVKVLDMLHTNEPMLVSSIRAYRAGLMAALWSRNYTVAGGRKLDLIAIQHDATETTIQKAIDDAVKKHPDIIAVLGPAGDQVLEYALPALKRNNLVALAPYTGSTAVRRWEPHFYFLRTDPMSGVYAHIWYAIAHLRVLRLGVMYLTDVSYGDEEYFAAVALMKGMGYKLCGVFRLPGTRDWSANDMEFREEWEAFVATRPQAVIIMGKPSATTKAFIKQAVNDKRTRDVYLQSPLAIQDTLVSSWKAAVKSGAFFLPGHIITTGANPLPTDMRYDAIGRFRTVMTDYLSNSGQSDYNDTQYFLKDDIAGETMVGGWIVGEILTQIFASSEWMANREAFIKSLFNQRRYTVDDLVIGDLGGECSGRAASQGAVCECNQGGRSVLIKIFGEDARPKVMEEGEFTYSLRKCYPTSRAMPTPINAVTFSINDLLRGRYASDEIIYGEKRAVPSPFERERDYTLKVLTGSRDNVSDMLRAEAQDHLMDIFIGIVVEDALKLPSLTFLDPVPLFVMPRVVQRNVIYLSPTLDQEFFTLANYLSASSVSVVSAVILSLLPNDVVPLLRRTLMTHRIKLKSVMIYASRKKNASDLPREGWVFVLGIDKGGVEPLLAYVQKNPGLRIMIPSAEHHFYFSQFKNRTVSDATDRILFATSLPHWDDRQSSMKLLRMYHAAVRDSSRWSPIGLMGFAASRAIMAVADMMDTITAKRFAETVYSRMVITVDDMVYGPFRLPDKDSCSDVSESECLVNYGASSISVWSLSRSIDPSVPPLTDPITPSMEYMDPNAGGLTKPQLTGIVVGTVLLTVLLVAVVTVLICCRGDSRDNKNAPRERMEPVTLVFTDIESSTGLWAACPQAMPDAVATHHRLIRSLIAKYRCYEVKTIGDSFMIACRSVFAAVQLARDVQQVFLQHDWGTTAIDDAYRVFEERRAAEDEEYVPPTARLDAAVYRQYWNGVRLRIGVHTGLCDIRHDEVTKGYDYYGDTSNTAARTESVANGGQVLLTRAAYMALSTAEREQLGVTALGAVALRGVPRSVEMYQLDAVPGRTFAALRLEGEAVDIDTSTESCDHSMSSTSNNDVSSAHDNPYFLMMLDLFNPLPLPQRQKMLQALCERWGICVSFKKSNKKTDVCHTAMCLLAAKLARVTAHNTEIHGKEQSFHLGTLLGGIGRDLPACCSGNSLSLDVTALPHPRNLLWGHHVSRISANSESSITIVCRPPPSVALT